MNRDPVVIRNQNLSTVAPLGNPDVGWFHLCMCQIPVVGRVPAVFSHGNHPGIWIQRKRELKSSASYWTTRIVLGALLQIPGPGMCLECVWKIHGTWVQRRSLPCECWPHLRQKACNALRIWWGVGCKGCVVSESACVDTILWMQSLLAAIVAQCCSDHGH